MKPLHSILETPDRLPPELREEILAHGTSAIPELLEILTDDDDSDADEETPGSGWPAIHAVDLLVDLRATAAIEPMLDVLLDTDFDDIIHDRILLRLPELGGDVLEPALARLEQTADDDEDAIHSLGVVVSKLGVKDERVFHVLCEIFDDEPSFGIILLADYGDPRALAMVEDELRDFEPDFSNPFWRIALADLREALERLGGMLDGDLAAHVRSIEDAWERHLGETKRLFGQKIGRNDPCPCRSGKKFKKCCLAKAPADATPG
ncbi:MAG TPA: SEC-C metal-binding domain-containing protein [Labilithrix sp.]